MTYNVPTWGSELVSMLKVQRGTLVVKTLFLTLFLTVLDDMKNILLLSYKHIS